MLPRIVWVEEFKNSIGFEIGSNYDDVPTRSQLVTDGQSSCIRDWAQSQFFYWTKLHIVYALHAWIYIVRAFEFDNFSRNYRFLLAITYARALDYQSRTRQLNFFKSLKTIPLQTEAPQKNLRSWYCRVRQGKSDSAWSSFVRMYMI